MTDRLSKTSTTSERAFFTFQKYPLPVPVSAFTQYPTHAVCKTLISLAQRICKTSFTSCGSGKWLNIKRFKQNHCLSRPKPRKVSAPRRAKAALLAVQDVVLQVAWTFCRSLAPGKLFPIHACKKDHESGCMSVAAPTGDMIPL